MKKVINMKRTVYETDLSIPEGYSIFGMTIWCGVNLEKKHELNFEDGVAQFMTADDAVKFEQEYING